VIIANAIHLQFSNIGVNHCPQTTRLHLDPHEQCPLIIIGLREVGIVGWTYRHNLLHHSLNDDVPTAWCPPL
jgi:hypothetical protein